MSKVIIEKLSKEELENRGVFSWPTWSKEVSKFNWIYDGEEQCYIIDGEFDVETDEGVFHAKPGDFVIFKEGLKCVWDIKKPVKKHYNFL